MTEPLVSICVPTYRGAPWLAACLDSALAQTLSEFEVLVVDDESDDDTVAIAEDYAARDARVVLHRNPARLGLAPNWNRSVELARGTFIKFLVQRPNPFFGGCQFLLFPRQFLTPGSQSFVQTRFALRQLLLVFLLRFLCHLLFHTINAETDANGLVQEFLIS